MSGKGPIPPPTHPKPKPAPNSARIGPEIVDDVPVPPRPITPPPPPPPTVANETFTAHILSHNTTTHAAETAQANDFQLNELVLAPEGYPPPPPPTPPPKAPKSASCAHSGLPGSESIGGAHFSTRIQLPKTAPGGGSHPPPPQPHPDPVPPPPRAPKSARLELGELMAFVKAPSTVTPATMLTTRAPLIGKGCGARIRATHKDTCAMRAIVVF